MQNTQCNSKLFSQRAILPKEKDGSEQFKFLFCTFKHVYNVRDQMEESLGWKVDFFEIMKERNGNTKRRDNSYPNTNH